jgi:hypothetical protein
MNAWMRRIVLRLAPANGFYLHFRAGFDRLTRFSLALKFVPLPSRDRCVTNYHASSQQTLGA